MATEHDLDSPGSVTPAWSWSSGPARPCSSTPGSAIPARPRSADAVEACDVLLVTHGHGDHLGDAIDIAQRLDARVAGHPRAEPVARATAGRRLRPRGHEQGRHASMSRACEVTMVRAEHSVGWPGRGSRRGLPGRAGRLRRRRSRAVRACTTRATRTCSVTWRSSASCIVRTSRSCPSAATTPWAPGPPRRAVGLLGVGTVVPIHYGTFPALAGTPDELRAELAGRRPGHVRVLAPEPGESRSSSSGRSHDAPTGSA